MAGDEPDQRDVLARLADELTARQDERAVARTAVAQFVDLLDGAEHASLSLGTGRTFRTLAATSDLAADLADAQDRLVEGPCVSTASPRSWTRSGDVAVDPRWPRWCPLAVAQGISSVLSVRLISRTRPVGALTAYSASGQAFSDPAQIELALQYATRAAVALAGARRGPLG